MDKIEGKGVKTLNKRRPNQSLISEYNTNILINRIWCNWLTWSYILTNLSSVFQLSHDHCTYEYPPVYMEHEQHYEQCIEEIV